MFDSSDELKVRIAHVRRLIESGAPKEEVLKALREPDSGPAIVITRAEFYGTVADVMKAEAIKRGHAFLTPYGAAASPYDVLHFAGWKELVDELWHRSKKVGGL